MEGQNLKREFTLPVSVEKRIVTRTAKPSRLVSILADKPIAILPTIEPHGNIHRKHIRLVSEQYAAQIDIPT